MAAAGHEDREPVGADRPVSVRAAVVPGGPGARPGDVENRFRAGPSAGDPYRIVLTTADGADRVTDLARPAAIDLIYINAVTTSDNRMRDH